MSLGSFVRAAVFLLALCVAGCAADLITAADLLRIRQVTGLDIARDGSFAVYTVREVAARKRDQPQETQWVYEDHLWMVDLRESGRKPVQLTFGQAQDSAPTISPDGHWLAFVRTEERPERTRPQIWVMPVAEPREMRAVTQLEFGASHPRWRPDGRALLVASAIPLSRIPGKPPFPLDRPRRDWWDFDRSADGKPLDARPDGDWREIRNWLELNAIHHTADTILRMDFLGEEGLVTERTFNELYLVEIAGSEVIKSTPLTWSFVDHAGAEWAPDGSRIVFVSRPPSKQPSDQAPQRLCLWTVNRDGSDEKLLLNDDRYTYFLPQFTRDGKHIVALGAGSDEPSYRQAALVMVESDGSKPEWLTSETESSAQQPKLLENKAYYTVNLEGSQQLRAVDLSSKQVKVLIDGPAGVNLFAAAPGKLVYSLVTARNPNELYLSAGDKPVGIDVASSTPQPLTRKHTAVVLPPLFERASSTVRLTDLNATWLEPKQISKPEEHWIRRPDGTRIQYWLMKPAVFDASKRYPWIVNMHGGPAVMWGPSEFSMWHELQTMCAFGYGVLYVNPRGSSGYGYQFQRANFKDWGDGPAGDVLAALDDAAAREPAIDRRNLFLTGGSYAGYLTAWIIAHDHRFAAAAAQRGVYDLATFFGEGNAYRLIPNEFGGYPWEPETKRLLEEESPLSYVRQIETPLLILHGSQDYRTGVVQSQMLFRALKQLGKPVEYVRYAGAGHEMTRSGAPVQRIDHLLRILEFFDRYAHATTPGQGAPQTR